MSGNLSENEISCPILPPFECEQWPWALKIYTLGRFEIVRDEKAVEFSGKVQKKPLEMLKALIAGGGSETSEDHLADSLWPDADGAAAHNAFTTTLSRLRRLIGVEGAITFHEGKIALDPRYCWVDARAFERMLGLIDKRFEEKRSIGKDEDEKLIALFQKALDIYQGHFLPSDERHFWTISYRERLRNKFSRLIARAGAWLERKGEWEKSIEYYQKGLDIDDLAEVFYQHLMICHQQLGQHASAIYAYNRCKKMLSKCMEIEPSARTRQIYNKIKGNVPTT